MEVARCIPLLLQFFLHRSATSSFLILLMFSSTYSLHFILDWPCLHFSSTSCTIGFIKTSSSGSLKTYHLTSFTLASLFLQSQHVHQLLCIPLVHQLYTAHYPHDRCFCSSQNSYFVFS